MIPETEYNVKYQSRDSGIVVVPMETRSRIVSSVDAYKRETEAAGYKPWLSTADFDRLVNLDQQLLILGIDPDDYMTVVFADWLPYWKKKLAKKPTDRLPVRLVAGQKAIASYQEKRKRFKKQRRDVVESLTVVVSDEDVERERLIHMEHCFAVAYVKLRIQGYDVESAQTGALSNLYLYDRPWEELRQEVSLAELVSYVHSATLHLCQKLQLGHDTVREELKSITTQQGVIEPIYEAIIQALYRRKGY
jgi:hypothetical protein